jgi:hypothetical protein
MKSLLGKFRVLFIGLLILGNAEVWGADWRLYAETEIGDYYYNADSLTRVSKNIVRVRVKMIHSEAGKIESTRWLGKQAGMSIALQEINCVDKMSNVLNSTHYADDGTVIRSEKGDQWKSIVSGSMGELLYKAVCK